MLNSAESQKALQVRLHFDTGKQVSFDINDAPTSERVLEAVRRGKLFQEPSLIFANKMSVDVFAPSSVARLDVLTNAPSDLVRQNVGNEAGAFGQEVQAQEWQTQLDDFLKRYPNREEALGQTGNESVVFGRLVLRDGQPIHLVITLDTPDKDAQRRFLHNYFATSHVPFARLSGGVSLVNPQHIVRATYHPGAQPPVTAWLAQPTKG